MKDIYSWVPWFKELAKNIAVSGEQYLIDRAKQVKWKDDDSKPPLLTFGDENIDPFSFFYTLSSRSDSKKSRTLIYPSIASVFELKETLPLEFDDAFLFPKPPPHTALFHMGGEGDPKLLWKLFQDAVKGLEAVDPADFDQTLVLKNIAITKLTQTLFLVNPFEFIPIDNQTRCLGIFESMSGKFEFKQYQSCIEKVRETFPGCELYEVNLFAFLKSRKKLKASMETCFQVSTNVHDESEDHWEEFDSNNYVYTGWGGGERKYPLAEAEPGNIILARFGRMEGRGIGVVYKNDYKRKFDENHRLHVLWLNKERARLSDSTAMIGFSRANQDSLTFKAFRQAPEYRPTFELLDSLAGGLPINGGNTEYQQEFPLNQILYGPPGTGKTWNTRDMSLEILGEAGGNSEEEKQQQFEALRFKPESGEGQIAMVTFHQNFSYEDFIEGIRPVLDKEQGALGYEMRPGIFKRLVEVAMARRDERFVLIIDEINRGNIAKIFGELITLMESSRRIGKADETRVTLPYSGHEFGIPDNLYLIGTMNTADRSIQLLDTALRRRFTFVEMMPAPDHEKICKEIEGIKLAELLRTMNRRIAALLDREHQIGHTYFFEVDTTDKLSEAMRDKIFPLLQEYFFDDWAKIRAVLGNNAFVTTARVKARELGLDKDSYEEGRNIYERLPASDDRWKDPGEYRKIYQGNERATGEAGES